MNLRALTVLLWVWSASLSCLLGACRDTKADLGYCAQCPANGGSSLAPEASAADGGRVAEGQSSQGVSVGTGGAVAARPGGTSSMAPASAGMPQPPRAGGSSAGAVAGAAATQPSAAGNAGRAGTGAVNTAGVSAGGAAGKPGAAGGGGAQQPGRDAGTAMPRDAGSEEPQPMDSGAPMEEPCGGCRGSTPVCDRLTGRCVQCTESEKGACGGATPACDVGENICVQCRAGDESACTSASQVCDAVARRCVPCLSSRPDSCSGGTPICDDSQMRCVQCTQALTQACPDEKPLCDQNACVQCLSGNDCRNAALPRCENHSCMGCRAASDCGAFPQTPECDVASSTCVACTAESAATRCPGSGRCDVTTHTCAAAPPPNAALCATCVDDTTCPAGAHCASPGLPGLPGGEKVCLPEAVSNNCNDRVYRRVVLGTPSLCAPIVSCQAVADTVAAKRCAPNPLPTSECGGDGICLNVGNDQGRCSYACTDTNECPDELQCQESNNNPRSCRAPRR